MRVNLDDFVPIAAAVIGFSLVIEAIGAELFIEISALSLGVYWWVRRL